MGLGMFENGNAVWRCLGWKEFSATLLFGVLRKAVVLLCGGVEIVMIGVTRLGERRKNGGYEGYLELLGLALVTSS
jgi:hypothetical protein